MEKKQTTKYTPEGYKALEDELTYLKGEKTEQIKKDLAYARSLGDFSENSELDAAKDEQAQVAARISELEELIKNAEIIDDIKADVVNLGSTVIVYDYDMEEEVEYSIVGTNESDRRGYDRQESGRRICYRNTRRRAEVQDNQG